MDEDLEKMARMARIKEKMENGTIGYNFESIKQPQKEALWKAILKWPFRSFMAMFGIDVKDINKYKNSRTESTSRQPNYESPINSSPESFRDNYSVANWTNSVEFQNAMNLARMGDGRGDPPEPPHGHDEGR